MRDCADCRTGTVCVDHCRICTTPVNRDCPVHPDPVADDLDDLFGLSRANEAEMVAAALRTTNACAELTGILREMRDELRAERAA